MKAITTSRRRRSSGNNSIPAASVKPRPLLSLPRPVTVNDSLYWLQGEVFCVPVVRSLSVSVAERGADSDELEVVSVEEGPVSAEEVAVGAGSAEEEAVGAGSSEEKALGAGSSKEEARGVGSTEVRPVSVEGAEDSAEAKSSLAKSCSDSNLSRIYRGSEDVVSPTRASFPKRAEYGDRFIPAWWDEFFWN
ncbi:hypothetical protein Pcinc_026223 [Petrolisthes cinctipes]|uniref:Uncharacterized protein n=1 Tax=Petrolisthes cinctipes TaxID=88211 RepID=A0AAE1F6I8_PETCI|nr:hypothetical protein Pcinc_026223 [Petrolisthes cinctipes]